MWRTYKEIKPLRLRVTNFAPYLSCNLVVDASRYGPWSWPLTEGYSYRENRRRKMQQGFRKS